jgi:nitrile hydratase beta subunit
MDGIHDLGGKQGHGAVVIEPNEPVFHEAWERRAARVVFGAFLSGRFNGAEYRHAIERMEPAWYLASPYYEHMLTGVTTCLVEKGAISAAELDERLGAPFDLAGPASAPRLDDAGVSRREPAFTIGDVVRAWNRHPMGHTRCPGYVRGRRGTIVRVDGVFSVPDVEAHCDLRREEPTYGVRFEADELWGEPGDPVHVDLWQSYLERAE